MYNNAHTISDDNNIITINDIQLSFEYVLTEDQLKSLKMVSNYISSPFVKDNFITISGPAGCGKTTLLKLVVNYNNSLGPMRRLILGCALTHKARKVLDQTINHNNFMKIPTVTVASLLKKEKKAGYIGTKKYKSTGNRLKDFHIILVDEVSMLTDKDTIDIIRYANMYNVKVIFIGDNYQIPHPVQDYILYDNKLEKKDNLAFTGKISQQCVLNEIVRQGNNNPLSEICLLIRDNIRSDEEYIKHETNTFKGKQSMIFSIKMIF
jgi:hypothetical protein